MNYKLLNRDYRELENREYRTEDLSKLLSTISLKIFKRTYDEIRLSLFSHKDIPTVTLLIAFTRKQNPYRERRNGYFEHFSYLNFSQILSKLRAIAHRIFIDDESFLVRKQRGKIRKQMLPLQNCVEVAESQQFFSNCSLRINTLWRDSDVSQTETFNIGKRGARGTAGFQFRFREFSVGRFLGRFYSLSATKRLLLGCNQPRPHDARHIHQVG